MCKTITIEQDQLEDKLAELIKDLREPIYRGLHSNSLTEYIQTGTMTPKGGSLSVGTGVFFTNNLDCAKYFAEGILIIADLADFKETTYIIDTRVPGHSDAIKKELAIRKPDYTGYDAHFEVCKHDTISKESMVENEFVYTRRVPVKKDEVKYEIHLIKQELEKAA